MSEDKRAAEAAVAKQIDNEKMLKRKAEDAQAMVEKRQAQAEKAVVAGEDELAKRALQEKKDYENQAALLQQSYEQAKADSEVLKEKLAEMKKEYQEMTLKKD